MAKTELLQGDCLEKMKDIPDGTIDLILTDPPYGTTACRWDTVIQLDLMWKQLVRVLRENGVVALFGQQPFTSVLVMSNPTMFKYDWVWEKPKGTGHLNARKMPLNNYENISVFYKGKPTYNPQFTKGKPYRNKAGANHTATTSMTDCYGNYTNFRNDNAGIRYPKRVQKFPVVERGTLHPTQKPIELLEYLVRTYTNDLNTVLDFTMGSGSTGVACKNLNRNFIGIELDPVYFKIAEKRIGDTP